MTTLYRVRAPGLDGELLFDDNNLCIETSPNLKEFAGLPGHPHPLWFVRAFCFAKGWRFDEILNWKKDKEITL